MSLKFQLRSESLCINEIFDILHLFNVIYNTIYNDLIYMDVITTV
jgi:hypothetical protein